MLTIAEMEARKQEQRAKVKAKYEWDGAGLVRKQEKWRRKDGEPQMIYPEYVCLSPKTKLDKDCEGCLYAEHAKCERNGWKIEDRQTKRKGA